MSKNETIRLLFSIALAAVGSLLVLLHGDTPAGTLVSHIGFAFIVDGVLSTFHEAVLNRFERGDMANEVAESVHAKLQSSPPGLSGIRLISKERKGYAGYYTWVTATGASDLFFAGRSVLHRVDSDIRKRTRERAESILARRLQEGSRIRILFLDPRSGLVERLAREEKQSHERLLEDLARSIGICIRLHAQLATAALPPAAHIQICVFDEVPCFAYHHADEQFIVGFYFSSALGHKSGAYEVLDPTTKDFFADHFRSILLRAEDKYIVRVNQHSSRSELNEPLIEEVVRAVQNVLGAKRTEEALAGDA